MNVLKEEAAIVVSAVIGLITAVTGLLVAFGIDVSEAQQSAIIAAVSALSLVIVAVGPIIRQFVFSQRTTQTLVNHAAVTGETDIGPPPKGI